MSQAGKSNPLNSPDKNIPPDAGTAASPTRTAEPHTVSRWEHRGVRLGWFVSAMLHAIALLLAAMIVVHRPGSPEGREPVTVELATLPSDSDTDKNDVSSEQSPELAENVDMPELVEDLTLPDVTDALDTDVSGLPGLDSLTGSGDTQGDDGLFTGSGGAKANFFGVAARGTRFAYIVDVSASMRGARWDEARKALEQSIGDLPDYTSFTVVLFNSQAILPGSRSKPRWLSAKDEHRSEFRRWVRSVRTGGSTNPLPAFRLVLNMRPRPDAVYFLTDGEFNENAPDEIANLNRKGKPVVIHTIAFVTQDGAHLLRRIAEDSGGKYRFVPGGGQ